MPAHASRTLAPAPSAPPSGAERRLLAPVRPRHRPASAATPAERSASPAARPVKLRSVDSAFSELARDIVATFPAQDDPLFRQGAAAEHVTLPPGVPHADCGVRAFEELDGVGTSEATPANDCPLGGDGATVGVADVDGGKATRRHIDRPFAFSPTDLLASLCEGACSPLARRDRRVAARWRFGLPVLVVTPAHHRAVLRDRAGVVHADIDSCVAARRNVERAWPGRHRGCPRPPSDRRRDRSRSGDRSWRCQRCRSSGGRQSGGGGWQCGGGWRRGGSRSRRRRRGDRRRDRGGRSRRRIRRRSGRGLGRCHRGRAGRGALTVLAREGGDREEDHQCDGCQPCSHVTAPRTSTHP